MANNHKKEYWRGYRQAKINIFLAGLDYLMEAGLVDSTFVSSYGRGYFAGIEACRRELSELIRKDNEYEND